MNQIPGIMIQYLADKMIPKVITELKKGESIETFFAEWGIIYEDPPQYMYNAISSSLFTTLSDALSSDAALHSRNTLDLVVQEKLREGLLKPLSDIITSVLGASITKEVSKALVQSIGTQLMSQLLLKMTKILIPSLTSVITKTIGRQFHLLLSESS